MSGNADESGSGKKRTRAANAQEKAIWKAIEEKISSGRIFAGRPERNSKSTVKSKEDKSLFANTGINTNLETEQKTKEITIANEFTKYNTGANYNDGDNQETGSISKRAAVSTAGSNGDNVNTGDKRPAEKKKKGTNDESSKWIREEFSSKYQDDMLKSLTEEMPFANTGMNINMKEKQKTGDIILTSNALEVLRKTVREGNYDRKNGNDSKQVIGNVKERQS